MNAAIEVKKKGPTRSVLEHQAALAEAQEGLAVACDRLRILSEAIKQLDVDVALGRLTAEEAQEQRDRLLAEEQESAAEVRRLEGLVGAIPAEIEALEAEQQRNADWRAHSETEWAVAQAEERVTTAAAALGESIAIAVDQARVLVAERKGLVAAQRAQAESADATGYEPPEAFDEAAWRPAGAELLCELLIAGPSTPAADADRRAARNRSEKERTDRQHVRSAATNAADQPMFADGYRESLPEHLRDAFDAEVVAIRAQRLADLRELAGQAEARQDDNLLRGLLDDDLAQTDVVEAKNPAIGPQGELLEGEDPVPGTRGIEDAAEANLDTLAQLARENAGLLP